MGCGRSRRNTVRIALITPEYPGYGPSFGIGRYVADLAESLRTAGHTVLVLAATDEGVWWWEWIVRRNPCPVACYGGLWWFVLGSCMSWNFFSQMWLRLPIGAV